MNLDDKLKTLCDDLKSGKISEDDFIHELKNIRAFSKSDRFKLKVVDSAPFSMWACDKNFIIKYWECKSSEIYGYQKKDAINKNFLDLFVAPAERNQAENDCIKIIEGKDKPGEFINNIAVDFDHLGRNTTLMTNCFRIQEEESEEWLQAEFALPTDIKEITQKHDEILSNYKKLKLTAEYYCKCCDDFLKSIKSKVNNLKHTCKYIKSKKTNGLAEEDITKINDFSTEIDNLYKTIEESIEETCTNLKKSKSIEECDYLYENKYNNNYREKLEDFEIFLENITETIQNKRISNIAIIDKAKNYAIDEIDNMADVLKSEIKTLIQKTDDVTSDLFNDSISENVFENDKYYALLNEIDNLASDTKNLINKHPDEDINSKLEIFGTKLSDIRKKLRKNQ